MALPLQLSRVLVPRLPPLPQLQQHRELALEQVHQEPEPEPPLALAQHQQPPQAQVQALAHQQPIQEPQ